MNKHTKRNHITLQLPLHIRAPLHKLQRSPLHIRSLYPISVLSPPVLPYNLHESVGVIHGGRWERSG